MIPLYETVVRLLLGALLGGIIGFERHTHGRPAGVRTHLLVCLASVLVMIVSEYYHFLSTINPEYIRVDPARIAAGAITGVGFLGAGVIIKSGVNVHGLTTAACIWMVSAIGLAVGGGLYFAAIGGFVLTYLALWTLRKAESGISRLTYKFITVTEEGLGDSAALRSTLDRYGTSVENIEYEWDSRKGESTYHVTVSFKGKVLFREIFGELSSIPSVKKVHIHG